MSTRRSSDSCCMKIDVCFSFNTQGHAQLPCPLNLSGVQSGSCLLPSRSECSVYADGRGKGRNQADLTRSGTRPGLSQSRPKRHTHREVALEPVGSDVDRPVLGHGEGVGPLQSLLTAGHHHLAAHNSREDKR